MTNVDTHGETIIAQSVDIDWARSVVKQFYFDKPVVYSKTAYRAVDLDSTQDVVTEAPETISDETLKQFRQGARHYEYVMARARLLLPLPKAKDWVVESIESPGVWGVLDTSPKEHFEELAREQLSLLEQQLDVIGAIDLPKQKGEG